MLDGKRNNARLLCETVFESWGDHTQFRHRSYEFNNSNLSSFIFLEILRDRATTT